MKNPILLGIGVVVTILFLIFPAQFFEVGYYSNEFSNEMYNEDLYSVSAIISAIVGWGCAVSFYYIINSVSFSRWYHWLIMLLFGSGLATMVNYISIDNTFSNLGYNFSRQIISFCGVDLVATAIIYVLASFSIRWWSTNCRHTPIPE